MYPCLDNLTNDDEKFLGKSVTVIIKVKGIKDVLFGNHWLYFGYWTSVDSEKGIFDNDIEEWYWIPELGNGYKVG